MLGNLDRAIGRSQKKYGVETNQDGDGNGANVYLMSPVDLGMERNFLFGSRDRMKSFLFSLVPD